MQGFANDCEIVCEWSTRNHVQTSGMMVEFGSVVKWKVWQWHRISMKDYQYYVDKHGTDWNNTYQ